MLCEICVSLCASPAWTSEPDSDGACEHNIVHQPSWSHLVAAARAGCEVCALFETCFIKDALRESIDGGSGDGVCTEESIRKMLEEEDKDCKPFKVLARQPLIKFFSIGRRPFRRMVFIYVCMQNGDTSENIPFRLVHSSPDDPNCFNLARKWIQECTGTHGSTNCSPIVDSTFSPTRLIDLGEDDWPCRVRLIESKASQTAGQYYVTLSHCWGGSSRQPLKLLLKNAEEFCTEIRLSLLPRSFVDAIRVTKSLGYKYLWIDALCIIQDDPQDVARELKCMDKVYSLSILTIAASDAFDSHQGFLTPRTSQYKALVTLNTINGYSKTCYLRPCYTFATLDRDKDGLNAVIFEKSRPWEDSYAFLDGVLSERAWALQERALPICTVHYTKHQMVFECRSGICSESLPAMHIVRTKALEIDYRHLIKAFLHLIAFLHRITGVGASSLVPRTEQVASSLKSETAYKFWYILQSQYSARKLSFHQDRLNAIKGMADEFAKATGDRFVMGIWEGDFKRGLLWISRRGEDFLSVRISGRTSSNLQPHSAQTSHANHGDFDVMAGDHPGNALKVTEGSLGASISTEDENEKARRDQCHSGDFNLTPNPFPSWTWASRTTMVEHRELATRDTLPKWVTSYIGSAEIDLSQLKDGKITIHGLCRHGKCGSKHQDRCYPDGRETDFFDIIFDTPSQVSGHIFADYIDYRLIDTRTEPMGLDSDNLLFV